MTPPDSGEEGAMRYRHVGKPDSGEREAMGHKPWCQSLYCDPVSGKSYPCNCVEPPPEVEIPLSLAQRILAALEGVDGGMDMGCASLAAELRERMPR